MQLNQFVVFLALLLILSCDNLFITWNKKSDTLAKSLLS